MECIRKAGCSSPDDERYCKTNNKYEEVNTDLLASEFGERLTQKFGGKRNLMKYTELVSFYYVYVKSFSVLKSCKLIE